MIIKVMVDAYAADVFSSRKIAMKRHEDIAFRVLGANNFPAHRTISDFRTQHLGEFTDFCAWLERFIVPIKTGAEGREHHRLRRSQPLGASELAQDALPHTLVDPERLKNIDVISSLPSGGNRTMSGTLRRLISKDW